MRPLSHLLDYLFDDKRAATAILIVWMLVVCGALQTLDLVHSDFVTFGPSPHTRFMTVSIDTWHKWGLLAGATFAHTCITDFMNDAIAPWLQNTMQDHKTKYLPYSKPTCYLIYQTWAVYGAVTALFSVALIMSQIDFLIIRLGADLLVNTFTAFKFMRHKTMDSHRYSEWFEDDLRCREELGVSRIMPAGLAEISSASSSRFSINAVDEEEEEELTMGTVSFARGAHGMGDPPLFKADASVSKQV